MYMKIHFSLSSLLIIASFMFGVYVLVKFAKFPFSSAGSTAPVAIGRALGFLVLGESISAYVMFIAYHNIGLWFGSELIPSVSKVFCVALFYYINFCVGFIASKTIEDTKSMNYKIIAAVGIVPHLIISLLVFGGQILWHFSFWPYVAFVVAGGLTQIKYPEFSLFPKKEIA